MYLTRVAVQAAKRSRENKRQMEIDIRNKVTFLEEENALLQKEVATIKARFGIPVDQSILTPEERAQCLQVGFAASTPVSPPPSTEVWSKSTS